MSKYEAKYFGEYGGRPSLWSRLWNIIQSIGVVWSSVVVLVAGVFGMLGFWLSVITGIGEVPERYELSSKAKKPLITIADRNNNLLFDVIYKKNVVMHPTLAEILDRKQLEVLLNELAHILDKDSGQLRQNFATRAGRHYWKIADKITSEQAQAVADLRPRLGYGRVVEVVHVPVTRPRAQGSFDILTPFARGDSRLPKHVSVTLDGDLTELTYQYIVEKRIHFAAKSVSAVLIEVATGEIIALAQTEQGDNPYTAEFFTQAHELGSVVKPFAYLAMMHRDDGIGLCRNFPLRRQVPTNLKQEAWLSGLTHASCDELLERSSNIGAWAVASRYKVEFRDTLNQLGIGQAIIGQYPGQKTRDLVTIPDWRLVALGRGYGFHMTRAELARGYLHIASLGKVSQLCLVRPCSTRSHSLGAGVLAYVLDLLKLPVQGDHGTAKAANVLQVPVSGKTGTAKVYRPDVGYDSGLLRSTFVGLLPSDKPKYLVITAVDEYPSDIGDSGATAVQVFAELMRILWPKIW